eukprot:9019501-Pyramimonas_sp.AAC.2
MGGLKTYTWQQRLQLRGVDTTPAAHVVLELHRHRIEPRKRSDDAGATAPAGRRELIGWARVPVLVNGKVRNPAVIFVNLLT